MCLGDFGVCFRIFERVVLKKVSKGNLHTRSGPQKTFTNKTSHTAALSEQSMYLTTGCKEKSLGFDTKALNKKEQI